MKTKTFYAIFFLIIMYSCSNDTNVPSAEPISDLTLDNLVDLNSNIPHDFYNDLIFTNENTAYAISRLGKIIKTTDSGTTWNSLNSTVSFYLKKIQFVNPNVGYVIGGDDTGSYLLKTTNAGQSWIVINLNSIEKGFPTGIFFKNENQGFITGNKLFIKTTDGGQNWTNVQSNSTENFNDVKFKNNSFGIATTDKSNYYKTTNGGTSWQSIELTKQNNLSQIYFVSDKSFIKTGNKLVDIDNNNIITLPNPVNKLQFLNTSKCIGIGQHYETGFFPYGDITLTNDNWATFLQKSYQFSSEVSDFTAIAKINNHKTMIIGTGQLYSKIKIITY
ncbi:MAG: YCF48-related protein [Flavobacterium sp.]|uniref:WD40/YVTN/BNR-like repeat-containing protein n=1 Tax=Flavobacterium sp. TaxID=239 RepID=UPI0026269FD4|nr:YCF48-related protein [Flavobacterium sp.]MDD5150467.1 YCF48-related protein [Flavobacterium sp.]